MPDLLVNLPSVSASISAPSTPFAGNQFIPNTFPAPLNNTPKESVIEAADPLSNTPQFPNYTNNQYAAITPTQPLIAPSTIHDLYTRPEATTNPSGVSNPATNPAPISQSASAIEEYHPSMVLRLMMACLSLLSLGEVIKSALMAFRLLTIEFPIVESVLQEGQLTEAVFYRFCIKVAFVILAAILSTYGVFLPWISHHTKSTKLLFTQIGLIVLVFALLGVGQGLKYIDPTTESLTPLVF